MSHLRVLLSRICGMFADSQAELRLEEEMREHLALLTMDYQERGYSAEAAATEARRQLGPVTQTRETHREARRLPMLDSLAQDLQYAVRQLRASPGFTASVILTLALGIGVNTAIFHLLDTIVLRPLPVTRPAELVRIEGFHDGTRTAFSYPMVREFEARQRSLEGIFASHDLTAASVAGHASMNLGEAKVRLATGDYFRVLGVPIPLGRAFSRQDDQPFAARVAVISHALWMRGYGGRVDVIGESLQIESLPVTIIGVTPADFFGERVGTVPDIWLPMNAGTQLGAQWMMEKSVAMLAPMARLRARIPLASAQAELDTLYRQLRDYSVSAMGTKQVRIALTPGSHGIQSVQQNFARPLWLMMGIAAAILLLACSNLATLFLVRSSLRTREIGVRLAIGASRRRIIRQLLTESLLLAVVGGAAGAVIGWWSLELLVVALSSGPLHLTVPLVLDWRVFAFAAACSAGTVCLFGLAPAVTGTTMDLHRVL